MTRLRAFQNTVALIRQSSIVQQQRVTIRQTTKIQFGKSVVTETSGFNPEAFASQMPRLRQFVLQGSPIRFGGIHDLIEQCCDRSELIELSRFARRRWTTTMRRKLTSLSQAVNRVDLTIENAFDDVFYGAEGQFHLGLNEPERTTSERAVIAAMTHEAFPYLFRFLNITDSVLYWWLDAPYEPLPPKPRDFDEP